MKVDILENKIFNSLNPKDIENYLLNKKWKEIKIIPNEVSIWDNNKNRENFRIWLPLDYNFGDFAISMKRVVNTLSSFENRSQFEILDDFATIAVGDVIRLKSYDILNRSYTTLKLDEGQNLIQKAKDMMSAAACAAIEPKAVFPSRRSNKVEDFINNIRLGQTERGSYVIKLISPITLEQLNLPDNSLPPFERQVTQTLMKSLKSLKDVLLYIQKKEHFYFEPFQEVVSEGVSANLCDAIIGNDNKVIFKPIEISVSLSYAYPSEKNEIYENIDFPENVMPYIAEASRLFHEKNPVENFILEGNVTRLDRERKQHKGIIIVVCISDGKKRRIKIELNKDDYEQAIEAHKRGIEIYCRGELIKEGNSFRLNNPSNFKLLEEELHE